MEKKFEGWVEEVDSGKELRFHSAEELLSFMGQRFVVAYHSGIDTQERELDPLDDRQEF